MLELVIDSFAGGGGASTGIAAALGRDPDHAINHDPAALAIHRANHPAAKHWTTDLRGLHPQTVTGGRPVGLLWASPDCTDHSKAKGGVPRRKGLRDLAWVVVLWARTAWPRVIILENVEEFQQWGPLTDEGHPDPDRRGQEFARWVGDLKRAGYRVEWRELRACDYGAPTTRKRLYLIARRDGRPIVWPEPTHGPGLVPYRTAAECIDWSIPCPSIFGRQRPLAEATMRRIARGLVRYVLEAERPFVVPVESGMVAPYSVPRYGERPGQEPRCNDLQKPMSTVVCTGNGASLIAAMMAPYVLCNNTGHRGVATSEPLPTVTTGGHLALMGAWLGILRNNCYGQSLQVPAATVTAGGGHLALVAWMAQHNTGLTGHPMTRPVSTICARGSNQALIAALLTTYYGTDQDARLSNPLPTATTRDRFGLVTVTIDGQSYVITDIGMRMLTPRELFRAQGFPESYIIEPPYNGKPLTRTAQIRCCGNSVCPPVAEALVRSNVELRHVEPPAWGQLFEEAI